MARKICAKLILELRESGLSVNQIAQTRHISKHSVSDVFRIAQEQGIRFRDIQFMEPDEVYRLIYPDKHVNETMYAAPDYENVHKSLGGTGVTLKLLWEEYQEKCREEETLPVGYTKFCNGYKQYTIAAKLTNHLEHKPGDKVEIDWSGPTMRFTDYYSLEEVKVYLFVATLPYSQYVYVEPCLDMKMETFIRCNIHMLEYFGGVPRRIVCDNLKTGVVSHPKEGDIVLTDDYDAFGLHYVTAIMPAGVKKPKQKASVEGSVGKIATKIIARLRDRKFDTFEELCSGVKQCLKEFNNAPFQKREGGSRYQVWSQEEKEYLRPLPDLPYEIAHWVYGRSVGLDFHIAYLKNRYSCPYQYAGKKVDLRITDKTLEIFYKNERLTSHILLLSYAQNKWSTHTEDMPEAFQKITEWDDERIRKWADSIGEYTSKVVDLIFQSVDIKEQGYNSALSVLKLSRSYSDGRLETACELALSRGTRSPRYRHLKAILASNQDITYLEQKTIRESYASDDSLIGYLRGDKYYGGKDNA
jgi:transposase